MRSGTIMNLCIVATILSAATPTALAQDTFTRYIGEVTGTNVNVRSGPNVTDFYPCTKVDSPTKVTVVGESGRWLKILPPSGAYSVIAKKYVKLDSSGKVGTLTGDRVWVRAAGTERSISFYNRQTQLNSGDKVEVFGEADRLHYKIVSPGGVHFYIFGKYVKRIGDAPKATIVLEAPEPRATKSAPEKKTKLKAAATPATQPSKTAKTDKAEPATKPAPQPPSDPPAVVAFRQLESDRVAEFKKTAEKQDLPGLLAKYKAFKVPADSGLQSYADYAIISLENIIAKRNRDKHVAELIQRTAAQQKKLDVDRTKIDVRREVQSEVPFAAKGFLRQSAIYTGGATGPKRSVLRAPKTGVITAYVQASNGRSELDRYDGKYVGVYGQKQYVAELGTNLIIADNIKILDEASSEPTPPRPTVRRRPTPTKQAPAPKPAAKPAPKLVATPAPKVVVKPTPKPAKPLPKIAPKAVVKPAPKPAKPLPKIAPKAVAKPAPKPAKPLPKIASKAVAKPAPKAEPKPAANPTTKPAPKPIVKKAAPATKSAPESAKPRSLEELLDDETPEADKTKTREDTTKPAATEEEEYD